jgi:hypothetical protein
MDCRVKPGNDSGGIPRRRFLYLAAIAASLATVPQTG